MDLSGYYDFRNRSGMCLQNMSGNDVTTVKCAPGNEAAIWHYDKDQKTLTNRLTRNCLENGTALAPEHVVKASPCVGSANQSWFYDRAQGGTICNAATGNCIENGGPSSLGLKVMAYNDDHSMNKKWELRTAQCRTSDQFRPGPKWPVPSSVNPQTLCKGACGAKGMDYAGHGNDGGMLQCRCMGMGSCT